MLIRPARKEDAVAAVDVLRRSILDLCFADHQGRPESLDPWLANKTVVDFEDWLSKEEVRLLVAEAKGRLVAVGGVKYPNQITLNYVAPEARFSGISKRMLAELERLVGTAGADQVVLSSTRTARAFYLSAGYKVCGPAAEDGMGCLNMSKELS